MKLLKSRVLIIAVALIGLLLFFYQFFPGVLVSTTESLMNLIAGVSEHRVQVAENNWAYAKGGKGDTVLLLHGYSANKESWLSVTKSLKKNYKVVVPDLPGFGLTTFDPKIGFTISEQTRRLNDFINAIELDTFHIVGNSMGGAIAADYTIKYPKKIKSLILLDSFGLKSKTESYVTRKFGNERKKVLVYTNREEQNLMLKMIFYKPVYLPGRIKDYYLERRLKSDHYSKIFDDLEKTGEDFLRKRIGEVAVPTLIIWGREDNLFHYTVADEFTKLIKNSKKVIIDECGHCPHIDRPIITNKIINNFYKSIN